MKKAEHNYNEQSLQRAKILRKNMTECEQKLWYFLRAKRFEGHKFNRQVPIGIYIADFVCRDKKIIVELDGAQHYNNEEQIQHDLIRDNYLKNLGYTIIRFYDNDIIENIYGVLEKIKQYL